MAILTPGPAVAEARGKIGGTIFSRNRGGLYMKNFAAPTNPSTLPQNKVRVAWQTLITNYSTALTDAQRLGWVDLANANPITNRLGQQILLTGQNWYMRHNQDRFLAGLGTEPDAPASTNAPPMDTLVAIEDIDPGPTQQVEVSFDDSLSWVDTDGAALFISQGQPQPPSVNSFNGPWRELTSIAGSSTTPPTSPQLNDSSWTLTDGQLTWIRAKLIVPGQLPTAWFKPAAFFA